MARTRTKHKQALAIHRFRPASARVWALALAGIAPAIGGLWLTGWVRVTQPSLTFDELVWFVCAAPVVEELCFRGGIQEYGLRRTTVALGPISRANATAAFLFAGLHLVMHPPIWAAATIVPSIAFGIMYERGRRLWRPVLLHAIYNAVFFGLLAPV